MMETKDEEIHKLNDMLDMQDDRWLEENDDLLDNEDNERGVGDETLVDFDANVLGTDVLKAPFLYVCSLDFSPRL